MNRYENFHALFGLLLWIMVIVKFRQRARSSNLVHTADFCRLSRELSRAVYLLLYAVFGADQIIRAVSHPAIPQPRENLRDLLAYGIIALVTIRVLAALHSFPRKRDDLNSTIADFQHHK
jgi:cytochrome b561